MKQWLPRGLELTRKNRIKKFLSCGDMWQIYIDNNDSFILAVKSYLYELWIQNYTLPSGLFFEHQGYKDIMIFCSKGDYLVSSLESGPFPNTLGQVEAFSISFNTVTHLYPDLNLTDAIYIEEYSLILPTTFSNNKTNKDKIYGKWLSGGVNISANSTSRLSDFMTWLPKDVLYQSVEAAGFKTDITDIDITEDKQGVSVNIIVDDIACECKNKNLILEKEAFHLVGRPALEQFFNDNIIDIIAHQEEYKKMGIPFPGATILYGPPGCGKTYAVDRLSEYLGWKRYDIDSTTIASSYIHDTSKKIASVFNSAIKSAPSIIVIDEMEAFLTDRSISGPSGIHHVEEVAEFLRKIPEAISKGVLVFAMTNMIDSIDPAILRRGRFDHIIKVEMANQKEIEALLRDKFLQLPIASDIDIIQISTQLSGHPMSDISFAIREAGRFAVKNKMDNIDTECFNKAIQLLPKSEDKKPIGFSI